MAAMEMLSSNQVKVKREALFNAGMNLFFTLTMFLDRYYLFLKPGTHENEQFKNSFLEPNLTTSFLKTYPAVGFFQFLVLSGIPVDVFNHQLVLGKFDYEDSGKVTLGWVGGYRQSFVMDSLDEEFEKAYTNILRYFFKMNTTDILFTRDVYSVIYKRLLSFQDVFNRLDHAVQLVQSMDLAHKDLHSPDFGLFALYISALPLQKMNQFLLEVGNALPLKGVMVRRIDSSVLDLSTLLRTPSSDIRYLSDKLEILRSEFDRNLKFREAMTSVFLQFLTDIQKDQMVQTEVQATIKTYQKTMIQNRKLFYNTLISYLQKAGVDDIS